MPTPNEKAIDLLKSNPAMAGQFDEVFGVGASAKYLHPETQQPTTTIEIKAEPGLIDTLGDMALAVPGGIQDAIQASGDLLTDAGDAIGLPAAINPSGVFNDEPVFLSKSEFDAQGGDPVFGKTNTDDALIGDSKTLAGGVTRGLSQFATSFVGVGKFLGPLKASTTSGVFLKNAGQGAVADYIGFGGSEDRLADLMLETPGLSDWVPGFLAREEDDSEYDGRFKNALEGLILGAAVEPVFQMFRVIRKARKAFSEGGEDAAAEVLQENAIAIEVAQDALSGSTTAAPKPALEIPSIPEAEATVELARAARSKRPDIDINALTETLKKGGANLEVDAGELSKVYNTEKLDTPAAIHNVLFETSKAFEGHVGRLIDTGVMTQEKALRNAATDMDELLDMGGVDNVLATIGRTGETAQQQISHLLAGKQVMQTIAVEIDDLVRKMDLNPTAVTPEDEVLLMKKIAQLGDIDSSVKAIRTSAARVTQAGNITTRDSLTGKLVDAEALLTQARQGGDLKAIVRKLRANGGDVRGVIETARQVRKGGFGNMARELWINSILSGPKTHIVNVSSNMINTVMMPLEKMVGGVTAGVKNGGDFTALEEGARQFVHMTEGWTEMVRYLATLNRVGDNPIGEAVGSTFSTATNALDPSLSKIDLPAMAITSEKATAGGAATRYLGNVVRFPTRLLATEDEVFKQINYRAALKARLHTQARRMGLQGEKRAVWIAEQFARGFDKSGRGIDAEALVAARRSSFTQPLAQGSFTDHISKAVAATPAGIGTYVAPFIRTPANIISAVATRTPLVRRLTQEFKDDMAAGGVRAAEAEGRLIVGMGMYSVAVSAALSGRITGGGPSDSVKLRHKMATGWRPYSFVTTNDQGVKEYIPYKRLDPYGMFFGLAADFTDIVQHSNEVEANEIASAMGISIAKNLTSKTYLKGISDTLDALSHPDRQFDRWIRNTVGGFVPTGFKQLSDFAGFSSDPVMRETRDMLDVVIAKTPGLSTTLPPKRSWVTGEVIRYDESLGIIPDSLSPFTVSTDKADPVLEELARLDHGWEAPPRNVSGVDLSNEQYDRLLELTGTLRIGGKNLHDRLGHEFQKGRYDFDRERLPDHPDSYRRSVVDRWVNKYRSKARVLLLREDAVLKESIKQQKRAAQRAASANPERAKSGLDLLLE